MGSALWWVLAAVVSVAVVWGASSYLETQGYCVLVCQASREIADARAEAAAATDRAEEAEERAEEAERNAEGLSPWVLVAAVGLLILVLLYNELRENGERNITMEEAVALAKEQGKKYHGIVPIEENGDTGYTRILYRSAQVVAGSKDSHLLIVSFTTWRTGMKYPPGWSCATAYYLSTDPDRCTGWLLGVSCYEFVEAIKGKVQMTASATELAEQIDRILQQEKLVEVAAGMRGGGQNGD